MARPRRPVRTPDYRTTTQSRFVSRELHTTGTTLLQGESCPIADGLRDCVLLKCSGREDTQLSWPKLSAFYTTIQSPATRNPTRSTQFQNWITTQAARRSQLRR